MDKNEITITVGSSEGGTTIIADSSVETVANEGETIAKYGVGRRCRGKVVNFKPYGFFVETEDGGSALPSDGSACHSLHPRYRQEPSRASASH